MRQFDRWFFEILLGLVQTGGQVSVSRQVGRTPQVHITMPSADRKSSREFTADEWQHCVEAAQNHGLRLTANALERVTRFARNPDREVDPAGMWIDLGARVQEELDSVFFIRLENEEPELYEGKKPAFGATVADHFPSLDRDIREAGRCLALGRYTASVFHLMRTLDGGLAMLARAAGIRQHNPTWRAALDRIEKRIREHEQRAGRRLPKARLEFLAGAAATLRTFKDAWRNRSTHNLDAYYDREQALDIWNAVGAFLRHLATKLKERGVP